MIDVNDILKNAFIDSQLIGYSVKSYNFSSEFENKMQRLIKSQKGIMRIINTTGKRVACVILAVTLSLTTVACSIKEVREPIIEEIQRFFVNAKELLTGTAADEVSELFPTDVTKIVGTSYISESKNRYVIDDEKNVTAFIKLLSETYWGENTDRFENANTYWVFDFYDEDKQSIFQIRMCNDSLNSRSKISIVKDGEEKYYHISNKTYREILAFTNRRFYLHDSKLERPKSETVDKIRVKAIKNIDDEELKNIKNEIRNAHYETEKFLLQNVSMLKEKDSIYWEYVLSGEKFQDPISGHERLYTVRDDVIEALEYIISVTEDKSTEEKLRNISKLWNKALKEHDLEGLFEAHEYIHDYDYYLYNYPTRYVYDNYADYQGLDDYFGRIED